MAKIIVFDFDGVLIDSKQMYVHLTKQALSEKNFEVQFEKIQKILIPSIKGTIELLIPKHKKNREIIIDEIVARIIEFTSTKGLDLVSLAPEAMETLDNLKEFGCKTFLITNSHSSFTNKVLDKYQIKHYFNSIITLDSGFPTKDLAMNNILDTEKIKPSEILYVGDTKLDVELSKRVGCKVVIIFNELSWDFPNIGSIKRLSPDHILENLSHLITVLKNSTSEKK